MWDLLMTMIVQGPPHAWVYLFLKSKVHCSCLYACAIIINNYHASMNYRIHSEPELPGQNYTMSCIRIYVLLIYINGACVHHYGTLNLQLDRHKSLHAYTMHVLSYALKETPYFIFVTENLLAKNFMVCIVKVVQAQIRYYRHTCLFSKRSIHHDQHAEDNLSV